MKIKDAIDVVISHNAEVQLTVDMHDGFSNTIWKGMAHSIPEQYLNREFKPLTGYMPYNMSDAGYLLIELVD